MTEKKLSTLVINQVESLDVYNKLKAQGKINTDELYMISGEADQVSGIKGDKETTYRTGNVNLTPEDIGALPDTTEIPTKVSELENDSGYAKSADLATVAKTGSYVNLSDTPYISNEQISIKFRNNQGGTSTKVFTLNQASAATIDIYNPTKLSEFENDSGFLTEHQSLVDYAKTADLAKVATSGSYNDLTNKPTIGDGEISISYRNSTGGTTSNRFTLNDTMAHKIDIYTPTKLSEFTNDTNYATQDYVDQEVNTVKEAIPTKVSDLENDEELYINITGTNDTYTADKTFEEINAAFNNKRIYILFNGVIFFLVARNGQAFVFECRSQATVTRIMITINNDTVLSTFSLQTSNLVNTIDSTSTVNAYPSAKAVYDFVQNNNTSTTIITWSENVE